MHSSIPAPATIRFDLCSSKNAQCVLRLSSSIIKRLKMPLPGAIDFSYLVAIVSISSNEIDRGGGEGFVPIYSLKAHESWLERPSVCQ